MPAPSPLSTLRLPESVRRRLEVASAMAWESLVETHASHALRLIALLSDRKSFASVVERYLEEMEVGEPMAAAVRTRVLAALRDAERDGTGRPSLRLVLPGMEEPGEEGWKRFRPDVIMRGVKERHRRKEQTELWIQLAIARAEEGLISAHVDNAITFAALLEPHLELDRAVQEYLAVLGIGGSRGQAVFQRTMARLAEAHLPLAETPQPSLPEERSPTSEGAGGADAAAG